MAINAGCCGGSRSIVVDGGDTDTTITTADQDGRTYTITSDVKISDDPDNALVVRDDGLYVPAAYNDGLDMVDTIVESNTPTPPTDLAPADGAGHVVSTISATFTNPSETRPLSVTLTPQIAGIGLIVDEDPVDIWFGAYAVLTGDLERTVSSSYRWLEKREHSSGSTRQLFRGLSRHFHDEIPPGGEVNIELESRIRIYELGGSGSVNEWSNRFTLFGGTR